MTPTYSISTAAAKLGLSRSTLLYYEKIGLVRPARGADNRYRRFSERDLERLTLLQQLQAAGLSLDECRTCIDGRLPQAALSARLAELDAEIARKQRAREWLAALCGAAPLREWHGALEASAPGAHFDWLLRQGLSEKDALRLRWLSRDIYRHEDYMNDFERLFAGLDRHGPGSDAATLQALRAVDIPVRRILDIGAGTGASTLVLAQHSAAEIVALDNHAGSLATLSARAAAAGVAERVTTCNASMLDIPFPAESFDLLWAEGSAYIMGFDAALKSWRSLLRQPGYLVVSDLCWTDGGNTAPAAAVAFWQQAYPPMTNAATRARQAEAAGYRVAAQFWLNDEAWRNFYGPLAARADSLRETLAGSPALAGVDQEIDIRERYGDHYGYLMLVLAR